MLVTLCVGGLLFAFVFFSWVMPVTSTMATGSELEYLAKKTAVFVVDHGRARSSASGGC